MTAALFELGVVVATPGALEVLAPEETLDLLRRHQGGDWGELDANDRRANNRALKDGTRLLSAYPLGTGALSSPTGSEASAGGGGY